MTSASEAKESGEKRNNEQHYFSRIYEILEVGGNKAIIKKRNSDNDNFTFVVPYEKLYEKLSEIHVSTGHGGRDKMLAALKPKYLIHRSAVELFVKCCKICIEKKQQTRKGLVVRPILSKQWNHRGQVDLIDFQSTPDGEYKWLMNYQDHLTKFVHLRPLKSKCAEEVTTELLKIFLEFGAPVILQSDNGREFVNILLKTMTAKWPLCKIINGRPRHPQSQGSVERANQDVENMLRAWLKDNNSTNWSLGCFFVQWQKNSSYHRIIKRTPYKALFGTDFPVGLYSTQLPKESAEDIMTEEDLEKVIGTPHTVVHTNETMETLDSRASTILLETDEIQSDLMQSSDTSTSKNSEILNIDDIPIILDITNTESNIVTIAKTCVKCSLEIPERTAINDDKNSVENFNKCQFCINEETIETERGGCVSGQKRAAEKMLESSKQKLKPLCEGQYVAVEVPKLDRGPLDPKNILGKVVEIKNGVYQIGTAHGMLNRWFSRDELISNEASELLEINQNACISLREAMNKSSAFGGQGFKKCCCKPSKSQCRVNKCFCFKNHVMCNSKCHSSGPCGNK